MAFPINTEKSCREAVEAVERELRKGGRPPGLPGRGPGAIARAAGALGLNVTTFTKRVGAAKIRYGIEPDWDIAGQAETKPEAGPQPETGPQIEAVRRCISKSGKTLAEVAGACGLSKGQALDILDGLKDTHNVFERDGVYSLEKTPDPVSNLGKDHAFVGDADDTFTFGVVSDTHLGSKYCRLDVLNALYDTFAAEGIRRVYHAGNWIDGEAPFNRHDLVPDGHGMDAQVRYLTKHYPQRKDIVTYAVTGDDHEGWYSRQTGVDIGRYADKTMRDAGRVDWVNLGYMEAFIPLVNPNTGAESKMLVAHPGGGSAYALSYSVQKIIEALEGGEKPGIGLWGHYHKLWFGNIRNVWAIQAGTTQDQTPFMRSKRLEAHVGGAMVKATQDPKTGAIVRCRVDLMRWFNLGYYNERWSRSHDVQLPERAP